MVTTGDASSWCSSPVLWLAVGSRVSSPLPPPRAHTRGRRLQLCWLEHEQQFWLEVVIPGQALVTPDSCLAVPAESSSLALGVGAQSKAQC